MNKKAIIIGVVCLGLIAATIFKLISNKKAIDKKIYIHDSSAAVLIETSTPEYHDFESSLSFLGTFEPARQIIVGSDASGKVVRIAVEEGSSIGQGSLIAKVDDEMLRLQVQAMDVNMEGQRNDDQRYENLVKENAVPGVQLEKTKLGLRASEIQKKLLQKQLRSTSLVAPFNGIVTKRMVDVGSVVGPGSPLIELTDVSSLKLTVSVPERDILKFRLGQQVAVSADIYGDKGFSGKVSNINPVADRSHNFKVQIIVSNASRDLMAGMYGSISLKNSESVRALSIPRKALIGSSKNPQVYIVQNGKSILKSFTAGTSDGEFIEVISGLGKTDQIVIKGQVNLKNKSNIKLK